MSRYTIDKSNFKGYPVIEILKDGDSFWYDRKYPNKKLKFGVRKAITILTGIELIKRYWKTDGDEPINDDSVTYFSKYYGVYIKYEKHEGDNPINQYLNIFQVYKRDLERQESPDQGIIIGMKHNHIVNIGIDKCGSIVELEPEIKKFVENSK